MKETNITVLMVEPGKNPFMTNVKNKHLTHRENTVIIYTSR